MASGTELLPTTQHLYLIGGAERGLHVLSPSFFLPTNPGSGGFSSCQTA